MSSSNVEAFTLLSLGLITIGVRVYVRWSLVGPRHFQLDDYLMPLAGLIFTLETVAAYLVGALFSGLTNSYMTDAQRAGLSPSSKEYFNRQWGSKVQVIGWSFYVAILWLIKFCLAIFYSRLTTGLSNLRLRVRIAYVLLGVTYLMVELSILLGCQPMSKYWQINPNPGNLCQPTNSKLYVLIVVIPNVLTDFYLLAIPLPLVWKVNITLRKKLTLMGLFSGAAFVIMASIIRAVTILTSGADGALSGSRWACRETFVSIIVSNLPIIQPLIRKAAEKIGLTFLLSSYARPSNRYPLSSRDPTATPTTTTPRGRRSKKAQYPLSVPKGSAWGSDEHILEPGSKEITIVQETVIETEAAPVPQPGRSGTAQGNYDWRESELEGDDTTRHNRFSVNAGPTGR